MEGIRQHHPAASLSFKKCDVTDWNEQSEVFREIYQETGHIDIVVANAGIGEVDMFSVFKEVTPSKPGLKTMRVNLDGSLYCEFYSTRMSLGPLKLITPLAVKLGLHYIAKNQARTSAAGAATKGSIMCLTSNAGLYPFPVGPIYAASKHAIVGLVRSLARPLKGECIQINGLAPCVIETNIAPEKSLFKKMVLTPMSTLTQAVAEFVDNPTLSGQIAEIHGTSVTLAQPQAYVDEDTRKNMEMFWTLGYC
ncbi:hypothetical protein LTR93_012237 [Exophiala xenobiotica]|nr:hypothetical protein LTR93_012237 [Exophiala xenobiotica]